MMVAQVGKPRWFFYPGWAVLHLGAVVLGWFAALALISQVTRFVGDTIQVNGQTRIIEDSLLLYVLFPVIGVLMGVFQYMLLQRYLPHMAWWSAATFLGWLIPLLTGPLIITILARRNDTFSIMLGLFLIGATMAVPQWWMLRGRFRQAGWWILAHGAGWGMTGLLNLVTSDPFPVLLALALLPALTTGAAWWLFLDWLPRQGAKKPLSDD